MRGEVAVLQPMKPVRVMLCNTDALTPWRASRRERGWVDSPSE
jgi:hypothetical protein